MQTGTREEIDADLGERYVDISDYRSGTNQHEIDCGTCGKVYYTNNVTHENILRTIEQGLDNPFVCDDCQQEIDAEAYADR